MHLLANCDTIHSQSSTRKQAASARKAESVQSKKGSSSAPLVAAGTILSEIEMGKNGPANLTFAEDFLLEHSFSFGTNARPNLLSPAGSNSDRSVPSQYFGFPS
jgi:hypothetical protein